MHVGNALLQPVRSRSETRFAAKSGNGGTGKKKDGLHTRVEERCTSGVDLLMGALDTWRDRRVCAIYGVSLKKSAPGGVQFWCKFKFGITKLNPPCESSLLASRLPPGCFFFRDFLDGGLKLQARINFEILRAKCHGKILSRGKVCPGASNIVL